MDKNTKSNSTDTRYLYRYPAEVLARATPEHIWMAVEQFLNGTVVHAFGPSTEFDLVIDNAQFPPKAVFGIALSLALNERVEPKNFSGGEGSVCFRLLREAGYTILSKNAKTKALSANELERSWVEGTQRIAAHWRTERATGLSAAKKAQFKRQYGYLYCERCGEVPTKKYGAELGEACIEIHHKTTMVSNMETGHRTTLADLECLCANCHRITHKELRLTAFHE